MILEGFMRGLNKRKNKAPEGFEPSISCLLDRRFNQLSHGATSYSMFQLDDIDQIEFE